MTKHVPTPLEDWINRIGDKDIPIFGKTVQSIISVSEDDLAPASKLAKVVLQDASLTARVLKQVNSIYYNPSRTSISTVSRAVVVMGFQTIRNICLTIGLVDSLVSGSARKHLIKEMARAIHSAVQAREIALQMGDPAPEEVFVASLLRNIGDMAFWCNAGEAGEEVSELVNELDYTPQEAQKKVLGFDLDELTVGLVQNWGINELLVETLEHPAKASTRGKTVMLAHELAMTTEQHGWESDEVKDIVRRASKLSGLKMESLKEVIHRSAREATTIAGNYGAGKIAQAIPLPGKQKPQKPVETTRIVEFAEPDPMLQLRILRELSQLVEKKPDFTLIMEMVMEGIHRGIGFDRTLFSLITPDRNSLYGKFSLGRDSETFTHTFHFNRKFDPKNILFTILDKKVDLWVDVEKNNAFKPLITDSIRQIIGNRPFFAGSLILNGKGIGIIYSDRSLSNRPLDDDSFSSFRHFMSETSMLLNQRMKKH
jgi:HD-like signal output (HDOD) protein